MLTKILAGGFVLIMLGAVVMGAITLFTDREETDTHLGYNARGQDSARGPVDNRHSALEAAPQGGYGRGQGIGRAQGTGSETPLQDSAQQTIEGVVIETAELVIETASGETVQVGLGPSHYREGQGFALNTGDQVQVSGYWEDGEFKAIEVTNLDTGDNITLRDASGRPMWAGQGRGQNRG